MLNSKPYFPAYSFFKLNFLFLDSEFKFLILHILFSFHLWIELLVVSKKYKLNVFEKYRFKFMAVVQNIFK